MLPQPCWKPGREVLEVYGGFAEGGGTVHLQPGGHTVAKGKRELSSSAAYLFKSREFRSALPKGRGGPNLSSFPKSMRQALTAVLAGSCFYFGVSADGADSAPSDETLTEAANATSPARVRLISQEQYLNTLAYVFGPDIRIAPHFAPFRRTEGLLEVGSSGAGVTMGQMQEFQRTAGAMAEQVVSPEHRNFLVPCKPKRDNAADARCAAQFLSSVGRLLYRRPLAKGETENLVAAAGAAADRLKDFYVGLAVALEGILVSPDMLFVMDRAEPDPASPGHRRLESYSLASRLSFFLWNAAPDDELLNMAARGDLQKPEGMARAVDYLLASPRLETGVRALFDDMLGFDDFAVLAKDPGIYPAFVGDTVQDAREQTLQTIIDHLHQTPSSAYRHRLSEKHGSHPD